VFFFGGLFSCIFWRGRPDASIKKVVSCLSWGKKNPHNLRAIAMDVAADCACAEKMELWSISPFLLSTGAH
jgi:hypothetical protein